MKIKHMTAFILGCIMIFTRVPPAVAAETARLAMKIVEPTHVYSAVYDFYLKDSVAWVRPEYNGKYGFVNKSGQLISKVEYDEIGGGSRYSSEYISVIQGAGMVSVRKGEYWGFADIMTGQLVIDCEYDSWSRDYSSDAFVRVEREGDISYINKYGDSYDAVGNRNEGYVAVKKDNMWGFADEATGKLLIECQYFSSEGYESNYGFTFQNEVAVVRKGDSYGLIDKSGEELTEFKYSYMGNFYDSEIDIIRIGTDGSDWLWGAIDKTGQEIIPCEYFDLKLFGNDLAIAGKDRNFGVIDTAGNTVIPFDYERITEFNDGVAAAQKNGSYGIINEDGGVVVDFQYSDMSMFSDGLAIVQQGYGNWGVIDKTGAIIVPLEERQDLSGSIIQEFRDGVAILYSWQDGKQRLLGADLEFITTDTYDSVGMFNNGYCEVLMNGEWKYVSKNGVYYDLVLWTSYDDIKIVQQDDLYGVLKDGVPVTSCIYDSLWDTINRQFIVRKGEFCGVIDSDGQIILPIEYDYIDGFRDDIQVSNVSKDGYSGLLNRDWQIVLPCTYNSIGNLHQTGDGIVATASKNDQYGVINQAGSEIVPFGNYSHISYAFNNGVAEVRKGTDSYEYKYGFINSSGTEVVPCTYDAVSTLHANLVWVKKDGMWGIYEFLDGQNDRNFIMSASTTRTQDGYDVGISIINTGDSMEKTLLVGIFDKKGRLLGVTKKEDMYVAGDVEPFVLEVKSKSDGALLRCFVWDSVGGMHPYDLVLEREIN